MQPVHHSNSFSLLVLRIDAHDDDAIQTKLFLLLQTEQYDTALLLLGPLKDNTAREFEKAYALYRLHREPEAAEVLQHLKESGSDAGFNDRGVVHLEAQLVCIRNPVVVYELISPAGLSPRVVRKCV